MRLPILLLVSVMLMAGGVETGQARERKPLSPEATEQAAANYQRYCALCHGENREGHVNDHAPSLRSESLMATGYPWALAMATGYGRPGTPMPPFVDEVGGPMSWPEVRDLVQWLSEISGVAPAPVGRAAVAGNADSGRHLYGEHCATCHGENGEGGTGTALGNAAMLALTPDPFLRYAIEHGRDGTEMTGFGDRLSASEIDDVTAFLRSRASGWAVTRPVYRAPPDADDYVLNPTAEPPDFELAEDVYVSAVDLENALREGRRMVLLDTRSLPLWQMAHIEGSVPLPYYYNLRELDTLAADLPRDDTMIVTYCECPRAAARYVNRKLADLGFEHLAVLYEGIQGWIALGYPVVQGQTEAVAGAATVSAE